MTNPHIHRSLQAPNHTSLGFTLIELLVVIGIMALILGVVLARYRDFDSSILLRNMAYEAALVLRDAQQKSISAVGVGNDFDIPYGVHFTRLSSTYLLFADTDDDRQYEAANGEPVISDITLTNGARIDSICVIPQGLLTDLCGLSWVDISFKRPHLNTSIRYPSGSSIRSADRAVIGIRSRNSNYRYVEVYTTGRISIE